MCCLGCLGVSSLEKCLSPLPILKSGCTISFMLCFKSSLYIQDSNPLSGYGLQIISHNLYKIFSFSESPICLFLKFSDCAFTAPSKKSLPNPLSWILKRFFPTYSSKSFTVLGLTFRSLIYFKLTFAYGVR